MCKMMPMKPSVQTLLNDFNESEVAYVPVDLLEVNAIIQKFKRQRNAQTINDIEEALKTYTEYCDLLQRIHVYKPVGVNWEELKKCKRPVEPQNYERNERKAQARLDNFKPKLYDKWFGAPQKEINRLENFIEQARFKDVLEYQQAMQRYEESLTSWMELQQLYTRFHQGKSTAYKEVLHFFNPFALVEAFGAQIGFHIEGKKIDYDVYITPETVVPSYEFNRMSNAALMKCKLSKKSLNTLLRNHISSVALKIVREIVNLLPMEEIRINLYFKSLNEEHQSQCECVMSVLFNADKVAKLDFENENINHLLIAFKREIHFNTYQGFEPVLKVPFTDDLPTFMSRVN